MFVYLTKKICTNKVKLTMNPLVFINMTRVNKK